MVYFTCQSIYIKERYALSEFLFNILLLEFQASHRIPTYTLPLPTLAGIFLYSFFKDETTPFCFFLRYNVYVEQLINEFLSLGWIVW